MSAGKRRLKPRLPRRPQPRRCRMHLQAAEKFGKTENSPWPPSTTTTMSQPTQDTSSDLADWLAKQPCWLQQAAADLLAEKTVGKEEMIAYTKMAISEAAGEIKGAVQNIQWTALGSVGGGAIHLQSVGEVIGIGQLNPQVPLSFGVEQIAVVFGANGSGKSSYVRILKHICGARQQGSIHANVFAKATTAQQCSIAYRDGENEENSTWSPPDGVLAKLSTIDIFDTHCGHAYLDAEGEASYEPRVLAFLSDLAVIADKAAALLQRGIEAKPSALPILPNDHAATVIGGWYKTLNAQTTQDAVDTKCSWSDEFDEEFASLAKYLAERSPKERAKELETKKSFVDGMVILLTSHCAAYSDESCSGIVSLRKTALEAQKAAELAAQLSLGEAILDGVGTEQWLALWATARLFSTEAAYPYDKFPNTGDDARCVLCQQELSSEGKQRLQAFESYVINQTSSDAKKAKAALSAAISRLPDLPSDETLEAKCTSGGLPETDLLAIKRFYELLDARRTLLFSDSPTPEFGASPVIEKWVATAQAVSAGYAESAKHFLEGFNEQERLLKLSRQKELSAHQWVHAQKTAIEAEVARLLKIQSLEKAKGLCGTLAISRKKGALAEELITPAYITSFNAELKRLGARSVSVELTKTRVSRGSILHQVRLRNAVNSRPIQEVLSEGEYRIVCIAAFLADVAAKPNGSTFVFDDPISSLDLDYEESVVQRLVEVAAKRQVIIFTHRLSLLGMVQDYAKKADVAMRAIHIRRETWGAGEPGDEAIEAAKPKVVLNELLPKRIKAARGVLAEQGQAAHKHIPNSPCIA
ncbi:hypothetical protein FEM03_01950 [Phragmitibacter flavus]|uniref:Protein CR006 P-loop domain-containing protein n=2 Tax=Phragmitibacter flavus TaxID=2576071 RepID=A0A5R8KKJ7_9BACT|nr:hypothetical protein FEM03_01950 [Phragmitibacter flavus]